MKIRIFIFLLCAAPYAYAQSVSDTLKIKQVDIIDKKENKNLPNQIPISNDLLKEYSLQNLSKLLEDNSAITIKSWGYGGLAIPAFRGTSPNHTKVMWNGIPLNSPMNGQLDFSALPISSMQKISLIYGGNSSRYGSGAVGGVILLENQADINKHFSIKLEQSLASFQNSASAIHVGFGSEKLQSKTVLNYASGKNDFEYLNTQIFQPEVQRMKNAEQLSKGFLQEIYYRPTKKSLFSIRSWFQDVDKNLPGTMLNTNNRTELANTTWRNVLGYELKNGKNVFEAKQAWTHENLLYKENIIGFNELSIADHFFTSLEDRFAFNENNRVLVRSESSVETGYDKVFLSAKYRYIQNFIAGYEAEWFNTSFFVNVRKAFLSQQAPPLCYQIGFQKEVLKQIGLSVKANSSRNYTLPSLNDLYWTPGGNPNLLPEDALNQELGLVLKRNGVLEYSIELNSYYGIISNWIIWLPSSFGYWSPQNFKKVNNKGLEAIGNFKIELNPRLKLGGNAVYNYTITTNLESNRQGDQSAGKQLIYVPYNVIKGNVFFEWKKFRLNVQNNFTGFRYTTFDNSKFLKSYNLMKIGVSKVFVGKNQSVGIDLNIENIFNEKYQSVALFAMPGRIYSLKIQYYFNKIK